jgi:hypothetical protein
MSPDPLTLSEFQADKFHSQAGNIGAHHSGFLTAAALHLLSCSMDHTFFTLSLESRLDKLGF